ncbi:hypothetical protein PG996_002600 [Apiospora saccharicola]|uniref:Uncharacterized protein n=1 Tax=Apiospora saccharicola TaxID=335842 RepID=A0ABR1WJZ3_9PEZI
MAVSRLFVFKLRSAETHPFFQICVGAQSRWRVQPSAQSIRPNPCSYENHIGMPLAPVAPRSRFALGDGDGGGGGGSGRRGGGGGGSAGGGGLHDIGVGNGNIIRVRV